MKGEDAEAAMLDVKGLFSCVMWPSTMGMGVSSESSKVEAPICSIWGRWRMEGWRASLCLCFAWVQAGNGGDGDEE